MQTKKKLLSKNASRENASSRSCRQQKKASERGQAAEKKVTDLITSSARKQRCVQSGAIPKKSKDRDAANNLKNRHILAEDNTQNICSTYEAIDATSINYKGCGGDTHCVLETIFSPSFYSAKDDGLPNTVEAINIFTNEDQRGHLHCGNSGTNIDPLSCPHNRDTSSSFEIDKQTETGKNINTEELVHPDHMNVDSVAMCDESNLSNTCYQRHAEGSFRANALSDEKDSLEGNLSSEVSAIYIAMQQSRLECVDEQSQDSMSTSEVCVEVDDDDDDEIDDFDPYLFIRNLPELSAVVPSFRPMLLPKQTRSCPPTTLVLDLDETLVHSTLEHCEDADFTFPVNFNFKEHTVYVRCRPYLKDFMERVSSLFEIIVFTASQSIYAEQLLNVLDPKRKVFRHRVYRDSCVYVEGNYLKDLTILGRDLAHVIIIDNSPQAFGFQVDNGIPIESWFNDRTDHALLSLLPFLESLVGVEDVRPIIAEKFNLRRKVAAAVDPSLNFNKGRSLCKYVKEH